MAVAVFHQARHQRGAELRVLAAGIVQREGRDIELPLHHGIPLLARLEQRGAGIALHLHADVGGGGIDGKAEFSEGFLLTGALGQQTRSFRYEVEMSFAQNDVDKADTGGGLASCFCAPGLFHNRPTSVTAMSKATKAKTPSASFKSCNHVRRARYIKASLF